MQKAEPFIQFVKSTLDKCTWATTSEEKEKIFKHIYCVLNQLYLIPYTPDIMSHLFYGDFKINKLNQVEQTWRDLESQTECARLFYHQPDTNIEKIISEYSKNDVVGYVNLYWNEDIINKFFKF